MTISDERLALDVFAEAEMIDDWVWSSGRGRIYLELPPECVADIHRPGSADAAVAWWLTQPEIAGQMEALNPADVADELAEYGAWDENELSDHEQNLARLLWIAACDLGDAM